MTAALSLDDLAAEARACRICVERPIGAPLPHEPRPVFQCSEQARILIAGQAPGVRVNASGIPFQDRSGEVLRSWLGVTADEFYDPTKFAILPMGFCFPGLNAKGGDLPPRKECAPAWRREFLNRVPNIGLTIVTGRYAMAWHLGFPATRPLGEAVAAWRVYLAREPRCLPIPHPSWHNINFARRNAWFEAELLPALRREVRGLIN